MGSGSFGATGASVGAGSGSFGASVGAGSGSGAGMGSGTTKTSIDCGGGGGIVRWGNRTSKTVGRSTFAEAYFKMAGVGKGAFGSVRLLVGGDSPKIKSSMVILAPGTNWGAATESAIGTAVCGWKASTGAYDGRGMGGCVNDDGTNSGVGWNGANDGSTNVGLGVGSTN